MSNKDDDREVFSEDITKNLVKRILEEDTEGEKEDLEENKGNSEYKKENIEQNKENSGYSEEDLISNKEETKYRENKHSNHYKDKEEFKENRSYKKRKYTNKEKETKKTTPQNERYREIGNIYVEKTERYSGDFFEDENDEYYKDTDKGSSLKLLLVMVTIAVLAGTTVVLAISLKNTKTELAEANSKIETLVAEQKETEQNETNETEINNDETKAQVSEDTTEPNTDSEETTQTQNTTSLTNGNNVTNGEYIVKDGDNAWKISEKVYGTGADFQKILDANGLTENDILKAGQKLKIPN